MKLFLTFTFLELLTNYLFISVVNFRLIFIQHIDPCQHNLALTYHIFYEVVHIFSIFIEHLFSSFFSDYQFLASVIKWYHFCLQASPILSSTLLINLKIKHLCPLTIFILYSNAKFMPSYSYQFTSNWPLISIMNFFNIGLGIDHLIIFEADPIDPSSKLDFI